MNITIIAVGKLKEKYLKDAISEYSKRIGRYAKLQIIEVPDEKVPEDISLKQEETIKRREGESILRHMKDSSYKIALCIEGKTLSSTELAEKIENISIKGASTITFVIGGSLGLSKEIIDKCDYLLSFSKMTFPHQLMRVILLEQVYRSFKIIKGEPYHK